MTARYEQASKSGRAQRVRPEGAFGPLSAGRRLRLALLAGAKILLLASAALAQSVYELGVSDDEIRNQRRVTGDTLVFCVNAGSILAPFERDLAAALSETLLLEHEIFEVNTIPPTPPYDFRLMADEVFVFRLLARSCDALMGFTLLSDYPDWLAMSPPYLRTQSVLAVRSGEFTSLQAVPPLGAIGTRSFSLADNQLSSYIRTLPRDAQWQRIFYWDNRQLIESLKNHTVDAILIWEPALFAYDADVPDGLSMDVVPDLPFPIEATEFVLALRPQEQFVNLSLAEALTMLQRDGTIDRLAIAHGIVPAP